ncbi:hypothetical protein HQ520_11320, partial [bacterium]|nr:hypothetical protein [bacterium]
MKNECARRVMMRVAGLLACLVLLATTTVWAQLQVNSSLRDGFVGTASGNVDPNGANNEETRVSAAHGFRWGGYMGTATAHANRKIDIYGSAIRFVYSFNQSSYVYTIFSRNGTGVATDYVDLSVTGAKVLLNISTRRANAEAIRLMLRDGDGALFVSEPVNLDPAALSLLVEVEVGSLSWYALDPGHVLLLNQLATADETALNNGQLTWSGTAGSPDFSQATGGGVYVETGWDNWSTSLPNVIYFDYMEWSSNYQEVGFIPSFGHPLSDALGFN